MKKICLGIIPKTYNNQRKTTAKLFKLYHNYYIEITNKDTNKKLLEKYENIIFILMLNMIVLSRSNYKKYDNKNYFEIEGNEVYIKDALRSIRNIHYYNNNNQNK